MHVFFHPIPLVSSAARLLVLVVFVMCPVLRPPRYVVGSPASTSISFSASIASVVTSVVIAPPSPVAPVSSEVASVTELRLRVPHLVTKPVPDTHPQPLPYISPLLRTPLTTSEP